LREQPILTFDTSAINRLADDPDSDALLAGAATGFYVQLSFKSVREIAATNRTERRLALLAVCQRLLKFGGCIDPAGPILEKMIVRFESDARFDWKAVDVGLPEAALRISEMEGISDDLAKRVRAEQVNHKNAFKEVFRDAKPHFQKVLATTQGEPPRDAAELVARLEETFWKTAENAYARFGRKPADGARVREFAKRCDPFRALVNAFFVAAYDLCVRSPGSSTSFRSGSGDALMSVCLPYCNQFVTNDTKSGGQLAFYEEVCSLAKIGPLTVRSYDAFRSALCVA
jgi:hypothetical protein